MGGSGFFSDFSPSKIPSFLSLLFSEIPPSVPRVPSLGPVRFGSSITPSLVSGIFQPSSLDAPPGRVEGFAFSTFASSPLSLAFFRSRSALVSTKGPRCGLPSLPSTGASLVPIPSPLGGFAPGLAGNSGGGPIFLPSARATTSSDDNRADVRCRHGISRRISDNGRCRILILGMC